MRGYRPDVFGREWPIRYPSVLEVASRPAFSRARPVALLRPATKR